MQASVLLLSRASSVLDQIDRPRRKLKQDRLTAPPNLLAKRRYRKEGYSFPLPSLKFQHFLHREAGEPVVRNTKKKAKKKKIDVRCRTQRNPNHAKPRFCPSSYKITGSSS